MGTAMKPRTELLMLLILLGAMLLGYGACCSSRDLPGVIAFSIMLTAALYAVIAAAIRYEDSKKPTLTEYWENEPPLLHSRERKEDQPTKDN